MGFWLDGDWIMPVDGFGFLVVDLHVVICDESAITG
jgi:hypothetical protein